MRENHAICVRVGNPAEWGSKSRYRRYRQGRKSWGDGGDISPHVLTWGWGITCLLSGASPGFGRGGARIFFQIWKFACREARGVRGHAPPRNFFKRCNLVRFRVYFDQILSIFFSKISIFLYKKINILNNLLLWCITRQEIFENMLRLMRFGVYFETKMAIFMKK